MKTSRTSVLESVGPISSWQEVCRSVFRRVLQWPWRTLMVYVQVCLVVYVFTSVLRMRMLEGEVTAAQFHNSYCQQETKACATSPTFNKFLFFWVDSLAWDEASPVFNAFPNSSTNIYRIWNPDAYIYSGSMFYSLVTGESSNHMDSPIYSDSLPYQFLSNDYKLRFHYTPGQAYVLEELVNYKDYPNTVIDTSLLSDEEYSGRLFNKLFSCGDNCFDSKMQEHKEQGESQFFETYELDHTLHFRAGTDYRHNEYPKWLVQQLGSDLSQIKNWIDNNPEYVLVMVSDHGAKDNSKPTFHGDSRQEGNQGWLLMYNPDMANSWHSDHDTIDKVDVCPTIASLFASSGVSVPARSTGISQRFTANDAEYFKILRANVIQLATLSQSTRGEGKKHVEEVLEEADEAAANGDYILAIDTLMHYATATKAKLLLVKPHIITFGVLCILFFFNLFNLIAHPVEIAFYERAHPTSTSRLGYLRMIWSSHAFSTIAFGCFCFLYLTSSATDNIMYLFFCVVWLVGFIEKETLFSPPSTKENKQNERYSLLSSTDGAENISLDNLKQTSITFAGDAISIDSTTASDSDIATEETSDISTRIGEMANEPAPSVPENHSRSFFNAMRLWIKKGTPLSRIECLEGFALILFAVYIITLCMAEYAYFGIVKYLKNLVVELSINMSRDTFHFAGPILFILLELRATLNHFYEEYAHHPKAKKAIFICAQLLKAIVYTVIILQLHPVYVTDRVIWFAYILCFIHIVMAVLLFPPQWQSEILVPLCVLLFVIHTPQERLFLNALFLELHFLSGYFRTGAKNYHRSLPYMILLMMIVAHFNYGLAGNELSLVPDLNVPGLENIMLHPNFSVFIMMLHKTGFFVALGPFMVVMCYRVPKQDAIYSRSDFFNTLWYTLLSMVSVGLLWYIVVFDFAHDIDFSDAQFFWGVSFGLPISIFALMTLIHKVQSFLVWRIGYFTGQKW